MLLVYIGCRMKFQKNYFVETNTSQQINLSIKIPNIDLFELEKIKIIYMWQSMKALLQHLLPTYPRFRISNCRKNKPKPKFSQNGQNDNSILNLRLKMRTAFIKPRPQNNNNNNKQTNSQQLVLFGHYISLSKLNRHHPCVHQIF